MNILRKRLILVSLALVIPLSLQAYSFKSLAKIIFNKKKTLAAATILGSTLSYGAIKSVDLYYYLLNIQDMYYSKVRDYNEIKEAKKKRRCESYDDLLKLKFEEPNLFGPAQKQELENRIKRNHEKLKDIYELIDKRNQSLLKHRSATKRISKRFSVALALGASGTLMCLAHYLNIFGEK